MRPTFTVALSLLFIVTPAFSQHEHHDHVAGLGNLGKVNFRTSCNVAAGQEITRAVALIHSFWYSEAEKSFRAAAEADPTCGIAWWGVAMANYHPVWQPPTPEEFRAGAEAASKAREVGAKTAREREYIEAINAFYAGGDQVPHATRALAYESAMEALAASHPEDDEASIFYALSLLGTASPNDKTYAKQKRAAGILNRVLPHELEHPGVVHYIIHSFDYPELASLALPAARAYAKVAPASPHALHMPSHIFTRLGLWDESIASNLASRAKAHEHVIRRDREMTSFDELHAVDYLVYAYLQKGREAEAKKWVDLTTSVRKLDNPNLAAAYAVCAAPARYALERKDWRQAANLRVTKVMALEKFPYAEAQIHFARAIGAVRSGNLVLAREATARLQSLQKRDLADAPNRKNALWLRSLAQTRIAELRK